jgi:phosphohistidine phosphatase SixA
VNVGAEQALPPEIATLTRMRLYLVRHGEAAHGHADDARPLTATGRADVARLAERAAAAGVRVDEIRHSGLVRARETAEILAARLVPTLGVRETTGVAPDDDDEAAAIELSVLDAPVLIVTHMPFVARLTGRLVAGRRSAVAVPYATAELRGFERDDGTWRPTLTLRGGD